MKKILLIFSLVCYLSTYAQSPWTVEKSKAYSQFSFSMIPEYSVAFQRDSTNGAYELPRSVTDIELQLYGEYGLTDDLTLIAKIPYKFVKTGKANLESSIQLNEEATISGIGNMSISLKKGIIKKKHLLTAFAEVSVPTNDINRAAGLKTGYEAWQFGGGLSFGGTWKKGYYFVNSSIHLANKNISHNYRGEAEFGYQLKNKLTFALVVNARLSFNNINSTSEDLLTALYSTNQEVVSPGLKVFKEFDSGLGLSFGAHGSFYSDYYAKAPSVNIGLFKKW